LFKYGGNKDNQSINQSYTCACDLTIVTKCRSNTVTVIQTSWRAVVVVIVW